MRDTAGRMRAIALPLSSFVVVVAGCLGVPGCVGGGPGPQSCEGDGGCNAGFVCALGLCVDPNDQRLSVVDVEVEPDVTLGAPTQSALQVDLKAQARVDVDLLPGVSIGGAVLHDDGDGAAPLRARVLFRPEAFIPGRALAAPANTDEAGAFTARVVDGARYGLTIEPQSTSLPPWYDDVGVLANGGVSHELTLDNIVLPPPGLTVVGRVVAGSGVAAQGIPDLEVRLVDADGRRASSTAKTDATGGFEVQAPAGLGDVDATLVVRPTAENPSFPSVTVPLLAGFGADGDVVELGEVSLGEVFTPARVEVAVDDADGHPVLGARVLVSASIGNGTFFEQGETGDGGALALQVPPGDYDVVVIGPPDAPRAGLLTTQAVVGADTDAVSFRLPARTVFRGVVRDPDGAPLASAEISLVRTKDAAGLPEPLLADQLVTFSATSGADGRFSLDVDPGQYRVAIRPPPLTNAPVSSQLLTISGAELDRDLALPARAVVAGAVRFLDAPVGGAYVRVFSSLLDERGAAILIGEGTTAADGSFSLVVPDLVPDVDNPTPP